MVYGIVSDSEKRNTMNSPSKLLRRIKREKSKPEREKMERDNERELDGERERK